MSSEKMEFLREKKAKIAKGGGDARIEKQHAQGKTAQPQTGEDTQHGDRHHIPAIMELWITESSIDPD